MTKVFLAMAKSSDKVKVKLCVILTQMSLLVLQEFKRIPTFITLINLPNFIAVPTV
jgi:hypothetical protein